MNFLLVFSRNHSCKIHRFELETWDRCSQKAQLNYRHLAVARGSIDSRGQTTCKGEYSDSNRYTCLVALCPGLPGWAGTRKVKPIWILLKQEAVSGRGINWAICKSAPRSRQITTPALHHSVFYRSDALPAAQPTASKYWRHIFRQQQWYGKSYDKAQTIAEI